jgi:hypothetical protein
MDNTISGTYFPIVSFPETFYTLPGSWTIGAACHKLWILFQPASPVVVLAKSFDFLGD